MAAVLRSVSALLLENIHSSAVEFLQSKGIRVHEVKQSLDEDSLVRTIQELGISLLGIRSKTQVTRRVFEECGAQLQAIGCFCIGTDQVDLDAADERGVYVFNAPFANTRSVAELVISNMISLARQSADRNREMHVDGTWNKTADHCYEIRGKTLGIVGYGHVGSQLSILAEAMGMRVQFFDIESKLAVGNATPCSSMRACIESSDFVSLHVPLSPMTNRMIGEEQIRWMQKGTFLLNTSRGQVVDLEAARRALDDGHLGGAAFDVYPVEPAKNGLRVFSECCLRNARNTILTPHIGGSTEEAQRQIGIEVSARWVEFLRNGSTAYSANSQLPALSTCPLPATMPMTPDPVVELSAINHWKLRVGLIHRNVPGVLKDVNCVASAAQLNVTYEVLSTTSTNGYMVADFDCPNRSLEEIQTLSQQIGSQLQSLEACKKCFLSLAPIARRSS